VEDKYYLTIPDLGVCIGGMGSKKIPYVLVTPDARPNAILDPGYVKVIAKNIEMGFKNVVYVRTIQQTRDLAEVKAEIEKYFELYGKDNIHGIYLDEINPHNNAAVACPYRKKIVCAAQYQSLHQSAPSQSRPNSPQ